LRVTISNFSRRIVGRVERRLARLIPPSLWPEPFDGSGLNLTNIRFHSCLRCGGNSDWLRDGVNGHLAEGKPPTVSGLTDAIVHSIEDPLHYRRLGGPATQRVADFTLGNRVATLFEICESVARTTEAEVHENIA
jgi:hypothetical protein